MTTENLWPHFRGCLPLSPPNVTVGRQIILRSVCQSFCPPGGGAVMMSLPVMDSTPWTATPQDRATTPGRKSVKRFLLLLTRICKILIQFTKKQGKNIFTIHVVYRSRSSRNINSLLGSFNRIICGMRCEIKIINWSTWYSKYLL